MRSWSVLGEGDPVYHQHCARIWPAAFPSRVGLMIGFDEALAHQIEAGADLFLMPSLYEPSGLNQLYSLTYGTPPVVRATGGLADTVVDADAGDAGRRARPPVLPSPPIRRRPLARRCSAALALYRDQSEAWRSWCGPA